MKYAEKLLEPIIFFNLYINHHRMQVRESLVQERFKSNLDNFNLYWMMQDIRIWCKLIWTTVQLLIILSKNQTTILNDEKG